MNRLRKTWLWLKRIRYRKGYGVHSPFAFQLITDVIYQKLPYYAYSLLNKQLTLEDKSRISELKLLLRLSNYLQPNTVYLFGAEPIDEKYILAGKSGVKFCSGKVQCPVDLFFIRGEAVEIIDELSRLKESIPPYSMMIIEPRFYQIKDFRRHWKQLRTAEEIRVTFDLYTTYLLFFDKKKNKQDYIVNF